MGPLALAALPARFPPASCPLLTAGVPTAQGGGASAITLFPLDVLKTRLQSGSNDGIFKMVGQIVKKDGVLGLWGKPSVIMAGQSLCEKFGYFFAYTLLRSLYTRFVGASPGVITTLVIGYASEWCQLPFTVPIDRMTVIMRNRMGTDAPQGLIHCAKEVWNSGNIHAGIGGYTLLALKPAVQFAAYEPAKAMWLRRAYAPGASLTPLASFMLGAYSRMVSDSVTCAPPTALAPAAAAGTAAGSANGASVGRQIRGGGPRRRSRR